MIIRPPPLEGKHALANALLGSAASHILLYGGSRSGKTYLLFRAVVMRGLIADESRHSIFRFRFNAIKTSIGMDTLPKVMKECFPGLPYDLSKTDWLVRLPNKSEIWLAGLDDKERTEKILGQEFATVYLNECSQISYASRNMVLTRLAQKTKLRLKSYNDLNPGPKGHWTNQLFLLKKDPASRLPLADPERYVSMQLNPWDNRKHIGEGYFENLDAMPARERKRFRDGEYADDFPGALWTEDGIENQNMTDTPANEAERQALITRMKRVVVAVDPSGCDGPEDYRSDEIGIVVTGQDANRVNYVLADLSGRYSPEMWGRATIKAFDDWQADAIVAEANFGGAMVRSTIQNVRMGAPVRIVKASRNKTVRAEPIAALYTQGLVKHAGQFPELVEQLCNFATSGYQGMRSPDRADAAVWGITALTEGQTLVPMVRPLIISAQ